MVKRLAIGAHNMMAIRMEMTQAPKFIYTNKERKERKRKERTIGMITPG